MSNQITRKLATADQVAAVTNLLVSLELTGQQVAEIIDQLYDAGVYTYTEYGSIDLDEIANTMRIEAVAFFELEADPDDTWMARQDDAVNQHERTL